MSGELAHKVTGSHLARGAYLYVRQSTLRQVLTNTESTARQYALRQRAVALGWTPTPKTAASSVFRRERPPARGPHGNPGQHRGPPRAPPAGGAARRWPRPPPP